MSEQAGSAPGGPTEGGGGRTWGSGNHSLGGTVQGARTQASRTLLGSQQSAVGDDGPETSFRPAAATSYV